jgi:phosphomannomutase / phosphoglucomutase
MYDIRGVVGKDLDPDTVRRLGAAFGTRIAESGGTRVAIGRDVRESSPEICRGLVEGILQTGVSVLDLGLVPTPLLYYAVHTQDVAGGIQVTGSHNPPEYNGMKLMVGRTTLHGAEIQDLGRRAEAGRFSIGTGRREALDLNPRYLEDLARPGVLSRPLRVVIDAGNGCASELAPALFRRLGASVDPLFCTFDGRFPNHIPDPTLPETLVALRRRVREGHADLGLAFDGDADRLGAIDETGRIVWGDQLLALFAREVLAASPGATILFEVKCSEALVEDVRAHGGNPVMTQTGHSLIKKRMRELDAPLAGEMSGHLFFRDWHGIDDALYAAARLARWVAQSGRPLSYHVDSLPRYAASPEIRVACDDARKFAIVAAVGDRYRATHALVELDGARISFASGWGLVRASNTEPALVVRAEGRTEAQRDAILEELHALLSGFGLTEWPNPT